MSKKVEKTIIGLACIGAVAGAVIAYLKTVHKNGEAFDDDFDDFSDEFENGERSYTTIPKEGAVKAEKIKEKAETLADDAKDTAKEVAEEVKEAAEEIAAKTIDQAEEIIDQTKEAAETLKKEITE